MATNAEDQSSRVTATATRGSGEGREVDMALTLAVATDTGLAGSGHGDRDAQVSSLYPSPRTVTRKLGTAGSGSIFARSRFTCTSRVLVSPT